MRRQVVYYKTTWSGGRAFGTGKLAVITREQRETRGVTVAGRGARRLGIKLGRFNQVVCQEKIKSSLLYVRSHRFLLSGAFLEL